MTFSPVKSGIVAVGVAAVSGLMSGGCSAQAEAEFDTEHVRSEIRNGAAITPGKKGFVLLNSDSGFCSATLLTPSWALTSAHCVDLQFMREQEGAGRRAAPYTGPVIWDVALVSGNRSVLAGQHFGSSRSSFYLSALNTRLSRDDFFGASGQVITGIPGYSEAGIRALSQQGSKLIAAGWAGPISNRRVVVARYSAAGALDTTFGNGGIFISAFRGEALGVTVDDSKRIVVAGRFSSWDPILTRLDENGALDRSFGNQGLAVTDWDGTGFSRGYFEQVEADESGRLVARGSCDRSSTGPSAGGSNCLLRYTERGRVDVGYGQSGVVALSAAGGLARTMSSPRMVLQGDAAIIAGSGGDGVHTPHSSWVIRVDSDGRPDETFGKRGMAPLLFDSHESVLARDISLFPRGEIAVVSVVRTPGKPARIGFAKLSRDGKRLGNRTYPDTDGFSYEVVAGEDNVPTAMASASGRFVIVSSRNPLIPGANYAADSARRTGVSTLFPDRTGVFQQSWIELKMGNQSSQGDRVELEPNNRDVALVELASPMNLDYTRFKGFNPTPSALVGSKVTCYGYGYDEGNDGRVLRRGSVEVNGVAERYVDYIPAGTEQLPMPGDSGGACFDANGRIVAVTSLSNEFDLALGIRGDWLNDWVRGIVP